MDRCLPLEQLPRDSIKAVFTDLDDTLTEQGRIDADTFASLQALGTAGYRVVIVSGRPAGWADALMRLWPLDAMVFENGAGVLMREGPSFSLLDLAPGCELTRNRATLQRVFESLQKEIPHLKLASDQNYRLFDYAIDFAEDPPFLTDAELERVLEVLSGEEEITHKLSSIHVNYWVGKHTKVTACRELLENRKKLWKVDASQVVFCGDSPNDEPLFSFFPHSVGVANIRSFLPRLEQQPRYLTSAARGAGFQQVVRHLLG